MLHRNAFICYTPKKEDFCTDSIALAKPIINQPIEDKAASKYRLATNSPNFYLKNCKSRSDSVPDSKCRNYGRIQKTQNQILTQVLVAEDRQRASQRTCQRPDLRATQYKQLPSPSWFQVKERIDRPKADR